MPIYRVIRKSDNKARLIDAKSSAVALRFASSGDYEVSIPSTREALALGVDVEAASEIDSSQQLPLD